MEVMTTAARIRLVRANNPSALTGTGTNTWLVGEGAVTLIDPGPVLPDDVVAGAQRLPISLRFNPGSLQSMFDSRALRDLERIVAFMRLPANANRQATVLAFGTADPAGSLVSTLVSTDRANMVADYLQRQGVVVRRSAGLGVLRPLVAPMHPQAAYINDRVEVWVN